VATLVGPLLGVRVMIARLRSAVTVAGATVATSGSWTRRSRMVLALACASPADPEGSSATTVSWPLNPCPNPWVSRSPAVRCGVPTGLEESAGRPSRRWVTGMAITSVMALTRPIAAPR
jgi:hypothetical protein